MDITKQMFPMEDWDSPEAFKFAGIKGYEPMLAKELETEESQDEVFNNPNYIVEEKFDGTRALVHFFRAHDGAKREFKETMVEDRYKHVAPILMYLTKDYSSEIKDMHYRAQNENVDISFRMNYLRSLLVDRYYGYEECGTEVKVTCDTQFIHITYSVDSLTMSLKISYREALELIDKLIDLDCYGDESGYCRVFSRRISKKTGFYAENTDSLPQIRDLNFPSLAGTVLDGEMYIDGLPFKEVSSTLNCLWDEAVRRQQEKGYISFHAFDILFYKGIDLRRMKLVNRKTFLKRVVEEINSPYIQFVQYQRCGYLISVRPYEKDHGNLMDVWNDLCAKGKIESYPQFERDMTNTENVAKGLLSPRGFYEYLIATGGEGVIVKPFDGRYKHKRGWEYSKIKAFITRELIVMGFNDPTSEYKGKFPSPDKWDYWEDYEGDRYDLSNKTPEDRKEWIKNCWNKDEYAPISKHEFMNWVGNVFLGVLIPIADYEKIPKSKRGRVIAPQDVRIYDEDLNCNYYVMEVCECSGYDEEDRQYFTQHKDELVGTVFEVKANGIMTDSGRMRHPRFLRTREDKNSEQCTWKDHIGG